MEKMLLKYFANPGTESLTSFVKREIWLSYLLLMRLTKQSFLKQYQDKLENRPNTVTVFLHDCPWEVYEERIITELILIRVSKSYAVWTHNDAELMRDSFSIELFQLNLNT